MAALSSNFGFYNYSIPNVVSIIHSIQAGQSSEVNAILNSTTVDFVNKIEKEFCYAYSYRVSTTNPDYINNYLLTPDFDDFYYEVGGNGGCCNYERVVALYIYALHRVVTKDITYFKYGNREMRKRLENYDFSGMRFRPAPKVPLRYGDMFEFLTILNDKVLGRDKTYPRLYDHRGDNHPLFKGTCDISLPDLFCKTEGCRIMEINKLFSVIPYLKRSDTEGVLELYVIVKALKSGYVTLDEFSLQHDLVKAIKKLNLDELYVVGV